jgi:hypothetical protein
MSSIRAKLVFASYAESQMLCTIPPEDKAKFDRLAKSLQEQLSGIKVYKVGDEVEREVYFVGKAKDGRWAGLKTTVVET